MKQRLRMKETRKPSAVRERSDITRAGRIVVKVGSSSLTTVDGGVSSDALKALVDTLGRARAAGTEIILISSGAVAAGLAPMGVTRRPRDLATQQASAAVGQGQLVAQYVDEFAKHDVIVGQVLLTAEDLNRREQYGNAFDTLNRLLDLGVLPIINEHDTVATHEIRFGDNDRLAALVADLVKAETLVLLSDVDAVYDGPPQKGAKRISRVDSPADLEGVEIGGTGSGIGTGGMATKVRAATMAAESGIPALVTSAANVGRVLSGEDVGTWFSARGVRRSARMLWLEHLADAGGQLVLDAGAVKAIASGRKSLLPAGITAVQGAFDAGDVVELTDKKGKVIARGVVNFDNDELPAMIGKSTRELAKKQGKRYGRSVVHIDDMVVVDRRR
ncbi:glutamate 5-kinase [Zhihengliuella flava]|uniref:Glutamate 5-kinase n=1 Tax=Zhihengliuella flava TaxID=1285193 RepID=A0A931GHK1_9MICC|nr:glutamate 5-kinase [Zhihengliuella flava]MBG6083316.1 glutamate 5-kinase [Zhihengliuella flava]